MLARDDDGCLVVGNLTLRLGVNTDQIQIVPNFAHQFVEVPLVLCTDRNVMGDFVENVELFNGDRVNLVEHIKAGNVDAIALDDINELIHGAVLSEGDIAVADSVLVQNGTNSVVSHLGHGHAVSLDDMGTATILSLECDCGSSAVETDTEALKLALNNALICHRLLAIKHDQNERASARNTDDLLTTTFTVLGAFNDTW